MIYHSSRDFLSGGFLGVDIFFVLSGFLITRILVAEQERTGTIRILRFYYRRALRLYPPLLLMLAVYLASSAFLFPHIGFKSHVRDVLLAGLYLSDYSHAFLNIPEGIVHSWSLAVEEHFYLLWPFVMLGLLKLDRKFIPWVLLLLGIIATIWRLENVAMGLDWRLIYFRFDTRLSGMLFGAALALVPFERLLDGRLRAAMGSIALAGFGSAFVIFEWRTVEAFSMGMPIAELSALCLIMAAMGQGGLNSLLATRPMVWIGKLSYGLYLWHYPVMRALAHQGLDSIYVLVFGTLISFACAYTSYHTVEAWSRKKRHEKPVKTSGPVHVG